jgi:molybdopterin converting factor small subunit
MTVHVLLFGAEASTLGRSSVEIDIGADASCRAVKERLAQAFPAIAPFVRVGRLAVNSEFASPDRQVRPGDEVALIGMVSGG